MSIRECNNVFVYGTLLEGMSNHRMMREAGGKLLGDATTENFNLRAWDIHSGFPFAARGDGMYPVQGEIYTITDLAPLDMLEGYPGFYNRTIVDVCMEEYQEYLPAWIYFIERPDPASFELPNGSWREFKCDW